MVDPVINRLHRELVRAIREQSPNAPHRPVTVAEIYQNLVPYRTARAALGVELNADYEHALLRLLAGEGDLVRLDPPDAREELRREAESNNPNVGLFRKFAACDVHVDMDVPVPAGGVAAAFHETPVHRDPRSGLAAPAPAVPSDGPPDAFFDAIDAEIDTGPADAEPTAAAAPEETGPTTYRVDASPDPDPPTAAATAAPASEAIAEPEAGFEPEAGAEPEAGFEPEAGAEPRAGAGVVVTGRCAFCERGFPTGREVRFCPYCGQDRSRRPCRQCGDVIEADWSFCASCGSASPAA